MLAALPLHMSRCSLPWIIHADPGQLAQEVFLPLTEDNSPVLDHREGGKEQHVPHVITSCGFMELCAPVKGKYF